MAKKVSLNGAEIAGFIQERQSSSVRSMGFTPKLAIVRTNKDPVTGLYLRIKQKYAETIGVDIEIIETDEEHAVVEIAALNNRPDVNGIIVQLPLEDPTKTEQLLNLVLPDKDVDGLADGSLYEPPTPTAILWLLAAYNVDLRDKKVLVVGQGRLVGEPLSKMLAESGVDVMVADDSTVDLRSLCLDSHIIISATGTPGLIRPEMVPPEAIIIDAGTSTDGGEVVGDVAESVREREDVSITPKKGGVGPLTVCALFENLLLAALKSAT